MLTLWQEGDEAGFVRLFDGTSLDGWSVTDGPESAFYVDDGGDRGAPGRRLSSVVAIGARVRELRFPRRVFVQGWTNSGIYLHAPQHGSNIRCGMKINIFQQADAKPAPGSMVRFFRWWHVQHHNSGVTFGGPGRGLGAAIRNPASRRRGRHYPTGSLYGFKHARYPRIEAERWWLFQLRVQDRSCLVRVNGDTVLEYDGLELPTAGPIGLQAHSAGRWTQFKHIRIRQI